MKIVLSSTWFAGNLDFFVDQCLCTEVRSVDIYCPDDVTLDTLPRVRRHLDKAGLSAVCISTFAEMNRPGLAVHFVPLIMQAIEIAAELGAPLVNSLFGSNPFLSPEQQVELYARNIAPCVEHAERHGVTLLLENGWDWYGEDPARTEAVRRALLLADMVRGVDSPHLRVTFDPCNFMLAGEEPFPHAYETLRDLIAYIHVKDVTRYDERRHGRRRAPDVDRSHHLGPHFETADLGGWFSFDTVEDGGTRIWADGKPGGADPEFVFTTLGKGAFNWPGLLCALREDGYPAWLCIEPHVELDDWLRATQHAIAYLHAEWPCLGRAPVVTPSTGPAPEPD